MKLFALTAVLAAVLAFAPLAKAAPIINGKVYEETKEKDCGFSANHCVLGFTKVPTGKILTINRVSCAVLKSTSQFTFSLALGQFVSADMAVKRPQFLTPVKLGVGSGVESYQSNDAVQLVLKNDKRPGISLDADGRNGQIVIECTILGRRTNS